MNILTFCYVYISLSYHLKDFNSNVDAIGPKLSTLKVAFQLNLIHLIYYTVSNQRYIPFNQVLCGVQPAWVPTSGSNIPPNAIPGGQTEESEPLFIGRVNHEGTITIGKVQPSHGVLYIPFGGAEVAFPDYEILVQE
ncbi:uncharacterized protein LOC111674238 [Orussus abietinus]|uniref:uncharacterized protein LOC111674238 n=1 Tax=Orussus abietinus TaxID=222816 RepID=UPI000C715E39|nr:uncharacterized protein LOC111674238 [Orussus abietinus]